MKADHAIFDKNYKRPKPVRAGGNVPSDMISAYNGFFEGLPIATKTKKGGQGVSFVTKEQRENDKLNRMQDQL